MGILLPKRILRLGVHHAEISTLPIWGDQPMQIYGSFKGFPLLLVHCLGPGVQNKTHISYHSIHSLISFSHSLRSFVQVLMTDGLAAGLLGPIRIGRWQWVWVSFRRDFRHD